MTADFPSDCPILCEHGPCLVLNKPGGLLTQAPPQIDSLEVRVKRFLRQREEKTGRVYLGVPHRLDRPVSGAIILARHVRAARRISEQFEGRTVQKTYWACVEGHPASESGSWRDKLRKVPGEARSEVVPEDHPEGREAVLHYTVLGVAGSLTWLEIQLETGRTHQIRIQCASRRMPVLGDFQYGAQQSFGPASEDERKRWIALHARMLALEHPMTREPLRVVAPLPACWEPLPFGNVAGDDG